MNSLRCKKCGMANFATEVNCRRCSAQLVSDQPRKKQKRPRRFSIISLAIYAALIYGGYYLYQDAKRSIEEVNNNDAYRVSTQAPQKQRSGFSRTEQDRQRASNFGNAVKESPSLAAKRAEEEQTQRAIKQASGGQ